MDCRVKPGNDDELAFGAAIMIQHKNADRRGQISAATRAINGADQIGHALPPRMRDLLERRPERIFDADAGFMARDHDRALDDGGFHRRVVIRNFPAPDVSLLPPPCGGGRRTK